MHGTGKEGVKRKQIISGVSFFHVNNAAIQDTATKGKTEKLKGIDSEKLT